MNPKSKRSQFFLHNNKKQPYKSIPALLKLQKYKYTDRQYTDLDRPNPTNLEDSQELLRHVAACSSNTPSNAAIIRNEIQSVIEENNALVSLEFKQMKCDNNSRFHHKNDKTKKYSSVNKSEDNGTRFDQNEIKIIEDSSFYQVEDGMCSTEDIWLNSSKKGSHSCSQSVSSDSGVLSQEIISSNFFTSSPCVSQLDTQSSTFFNNSFSTYIDCTKTFNFEEFETFYCRIINQVDLSENDDPRPKKKRFQHKTKTSKFFPKKTSVKKEPVLKSSKFWTQESKSRFQFTKKKIVCKYIPPKSPHNLIEEEYTKDPWALLVATIFLTKTSGLKAKPYLDVFLETYPTSEAVLEKESKDFEHFFDELGLRKRSETIWKMSYDYLRNSWKEAKDLYGIGKYGDDAYRMFIKGDTTVEPTDKYLKKYLEWWLEKLKTESISNGEFSSD